MKINLSIFNHVSPATNDCRGIRDQIDFLEAVFDALNIQFSVSYTLCPDSLNLLIENFNDSTVPAVIEFCERYGKRVCLVMTEHLNNANGMPHFGPYALTDREYIGNIDKRIFSLGILSEYVTAYFTLGELPFLDDIGEILHNSQVYRISYPHITPSDDRDVPEAEYDLGFFGVLTPYREEILEKLGEKHKVYHAGIVSSEEERLENILKCGALLNIPQNRIWKYTSPMRVIYNLRNGLPTLHLGKDDNTRFYKDVLSWVNIDKMLESPRETYLKQLEAYNSISMDSNNLVNFLNIWETLEEN